MKREKENLGTKQKTVQSAIDYFNENHTQILTEMKDFTQKKNVHLITEAKLRTEGLSKKNKEIELVMKVII